MKNVKKKRKIRVGRVWYEAPPIYELRDILIRGSRLYGDRAAVRWHVSPQSETVTERTYNELRQDVVAVQSFLSARLPKGSRIALVGNNSYPWMVVWLAVASGFGVIVPIDRLLQPQEVETVLRRSGASMLIYDASWHETVGSFVNDLPALKWRGVMDRGLMKEDKRQALRSEMEKDPQLFFLDDMLLQTTEADEASTPAFSKVQDDSDFGLLPLTSAEDDAAILFTSGTSDTSKAVILTNKSITADVRALLGSVSFPDGLRTLMMLPLHHAFENTCGFLTVLSLGGTIHHNDGLRYITRNLGEYHVQLTVAVPAILDAIRNKVVKEAKQRGKWRTLKRGLRLSTFLYKLGIDRRRKIFRDLLEQIGGDLRYIICGAAPVSRETLYFFRAIGVEVLAGYGLTEASPVVAGGNTKVNPFGTTGDPLAGIEIAIDDDGSGTGEILVRSDSIMKGYLDDPEATAEAIDADGWLHTADVGRFTRRGYLKITGRSKSMIVLANGKKVFPEEIEVLLNRDELIRDALVFGYKSTSGDVVLMAKLVLEQSVLQKHLNRKPTESDFSEAVEALVSKVNQALPSFKTIRSYFYGFDDMVKTTTQKVRRHIETSQLDDFIKSAKVTWQQLRLKNIDLLMALHKENLKHLLTDDALLEKYRESVGDRKHSLTMA